MNRSWLLGAALAATLMTPAAAQAANQTIIVGTGDQKVLTPPDATVNPADSVTWTYAADSIRDHHIHSLLTTGPETWDFGRVAAGTFTRTFSTPGSYSYECQLHPAEMHGVITVTGTPPANQAPTASITASDTTPANGASVTLDASASADADGTIAAYAWDLDGNGSFETAGGTSPTIAHAFTTPGPVTVSVRVTDNSGATAVASMQVTVAAAAVPPTTDPPPSTQTASTSEQAAPPSEQAAPSPPPVLSAPFVAPNAIAAPATITASAPGGQHLKRQRGVRVSVTCPSACKVDLTGSVKVGGKRLRLSKLTRSLGAGQPATLTILVDRRDLKALSKARGKAQATIKVSAGSAGQSSVTVSLKS